MRVRLVAAVIALFVVAGGILALVLLGPSAFAGGTASPTPQTLALDTATPTSTTGSENAIVRENIQLGTYSWKIPKGKEATTQIQAYAGATYVLPGKPITFYVSTQQEGTNYSIDFYRIGWYGGFGGRLMTSVDDQVGHAQGVYDLSTHSLLGCTTCYKDLTTGLVEADWHPSYTLSVPADWTTGVYLAKFTDANGMQTYAPFDVLSVNSHASYVVATPDTTYVAYNNWGGSSLYETDEATTTTRAPNAIPSEGEAVPKGRKVSFDRPYSQGDGSSQVLQYEASAIHWLERQGYDLTYVSDLNIHNNPSLLLNHKAYISLGHDEYWTKEMRDGVEHARDQGVGLAFMGADAAYWQMRFEPNSKGVANRTVVCYKVQTNRGIADLERDPFYGKDNSRVTAQWRDPILGRPENALIGIMFSDLTHKRNGYPWQVDSTAANSALMDGTDLQAGQQYGCSIVGYEWDRVFNNGSTPPNLHILATSKVLNDTEKPDIANTSYYIAPSGAMVFASGSIYWASALDSYRFQMDKACGNQDVAIPGVQKLMARIMEQLIVHHPANS